MDHQLEMNLLKIFSFFVLYFLNFNVTTVFGDGPKIVIIGAGASGVAAATKLLEEGVEDITILEAEDRIGGRIYTTKFGGYAVDLGAQWVHGEKGNAAYDLAWPMGLLENSDKALFSFSFFISSGDTPFDVDTMKNVSQFFHDTYNTIGNDSSKVTELESLGDAMNKALDEYFAAHPDMEQYKKEFTHFFEVILMSSESADSWNDVSSNDDWGVPGDKAVNWKERGYSTILDIMMKKYPDPTKELPVLEKTKLNTEVINIDYSSQSEDELGEVTIHTKNGDVYKADHVIVTPSLGVLKATHETLFSPPLSDEKKNFIENFGYGSVAKIYLLFEDSWWMNSNMNSYGLSILWTDEDRSEREQNPDKEWQLDILGFFLVEHKPKLLSIWISKKGSRQMENIPEDKLMEQIKELLQIFKNNYNITQPTEMLRTRWFSNDHFRGTYSYNSMDAVRHHSNMSSLAEPIVLHDKPKILFAGEATDARSYSTVHGAISAGWREANRLLALYPKSDQT